jgi:hypothetical protein
VVALAHLSAREIYQVILATAATAARRNAPEIQMHDLPCEALAVNANTQGGITWMH